MKQLLIVFLVSVFVVSVESCTPKAAIPSAARLSKQDYEKAIHKERRARQMRRIETLVQAGGYYFAEGYKQFTPESRYEQIAQACVKVVDSLINIKRFYFRTVTSNEKGSQINYFGRNSGGMSVNKDTIRAGLGHSFAFWADNSEFAILSRNNRRTVIGIKTHGMDAYNIYISIKRDGNAEVFVNCLNSRHYTDNGRSCSFSGYIVPLEIGD